nr:2Fe-2S iron-sulfur cluster-binding protein [uncultured Romboutsia sp.]
MKTLSCADSGSKYCPCHLAYSNDCIRCNMLNKNKTCDCMWQGVCIYNEVKHNKNSPVVQRSEYLCDIESMKVVEDNTYLIRIKIPKELSKDLRSPGAYVLIKRKDKESDIFSAPISVMDVDLDKNILEVIVRPIGIKTKGIINFNQVYIKGPYFNGLFGIKDIKSTSKSNCLIILNGLSQVNSINVIRRLIENGNKVDVFINHNGVILDNVVQKIYDLGANIYHIDIAQDKEFISDYIKSNYIKLVYSGGSNHFNKLVMDIVDYVDENIKLAVSNNNLICCGEGICGACSIDLNGVKVKTCKTQVNSREYLKSI